MQQEEEKIASAAALATMATITRFTSETGPLTKTPFLTPAGDFNKGPKPSLYKGTYETIAVASAQHLSSIIQDLTPRQCLAYGVAKTNPAGRVLTTAAWEEAGRPPDALPRNNECYQWPVGGGVLLCDHDTPETGALSRDDLLAKLYEAMPALEAAPHVWVPSASSCLWNTATNEEVRGLRGQHVYFFIDDATAVPRVGELLAVKLWLLGHGWIKVSKSGQRLKQTLIDTCVWQPCRLDFAAGADCPAPLEQRRGVPVVLGGDKPLDTRALHDLTQTEQEKVAKLKRRAEAEKKDEAAKVFEAYAAERVPEMVKRGVDPERAHETLRQAVFGSALERDFEMTLDDGEVVTVAQLWEEKEKYAGRRGCDPVEPDYHGDNRIAYLDLLCASPAIISHAHGMHVYRLVREAKIVELRPGSLYENVKETAEVLRLSGDFYLRGDKLAKLSRGGGFLELRKPEGLMQAIGGYVGFRQYDKKGNSRAVDAPDKLARQLLATVTEYDFPVLNGVSDHPVMTVAGRLIDRPGFDKSTGILLLSNGPEGWPEIPQHPTQAQVLQALDVIWRPFRQFPFVTGAAGVYLACLLTTIVRPLLPTSPAFMFTAPEQGTGKSKLGFCAGELAKAGGVGVTAFPSSDDEMVKILLPLMRNVEPVVMFDNVDGLVESEELSSKLTAPIMNGRILGHSEFVHALPVNSVFLISGNNARTRGGLERRTLECRLDAGMERPYTRPFDFDPQTLTRANRMNMIIAGLTLLAARDLHKPPIAYGGFDDWNALVGQAVRTVDETVRASGWTIDGHTVDFGEPLSGLTQNYEVDEARQALGCFLQALYSDRDGVGLTAQQLLDARKRADNDIVVGNEIGCAMQALAGDARYAAGVTNRLHKLKDKPVDGLQLCSRIVHKTTCWYAQRVTPKP
jgi:hypothetical protein